MYTVEAEGSAVYVDADAGVVMGMLTFEIPLGAEDDPLRVAEWLRRRIKAIEGKYAGQIVSELSEG